MSHLDSVFIVKTAFANKFMVTEIYFVKTMPVYKNLYIKVTLICN